MIWNSTKCQEQQQQKCVYGVPLAAVAGFLAAAALASPAGRLAAAGLAAAGLAAAGFFSAGFFSGAAAFFAGAAFLVLSAEVEAAGAAFFSPTKNYRK